MHTPGPHDLLVFRGKKQPEKGQDTALRWARLRVMALLNKPKGSSDKGSSFHSRFKEKRKPRHNVIWMTGSWNSNLKLALRETFGNSWGWISVYIVCRCKQIFVTETEWCSKLNYCHQFPVPLCKRIRCQPLGLSWDLSHCPVAGSHPPHPSHTLILDLVMWYSLAIS